MSKRESRNEYESPEDFWRSQQKHLPEWKKPLDDHDVESLTCQIQMISDSLAACNAISRHCSANVSVNTSSRRKGSSRKPSVETILPPGKKTLDCRSEGGEKNVIVSYMTRDDRKSRHPQKSKPLYSREDFLTRSESIGSEEKGWVSECSDGGVPSWNPDLRDIRRKASKVEMYGHEEVNPLRMINVIQRELKTLKELAPSVGQVASSLCDTILHYKECGRCIEKISSSLPWILNRIQKLIKYVTTKRQKKYYWPDDYSYLRLDNLTLVEVKEERNSKSRETNRHRKVDSKAERKVRVGKLEEVDVNAVSDALPGVQILLEVSPERRRKRFFGKAKNKELGKELEEGKNFPTLHPRNHLSAPLVQVLRPKHKSSVVCKKTQEVVSLKGFAFAVHQLLVQRPQVASIALTGKFVGRTIKVQTARVAIYPWEIQAFEEYLLLTGDIWTLSIKPVEYHDPRESELWNSGYLRQGSHGRPPLTSRDFLSNAPELVRDLLKEAEEEEMHLQKVRELQAEVKDLKELMLDVHKNQMELSKVLMEKGVYSQPMIKLTDPCMLEEENKVLKKAGKVEGLRRSSSVESLQLIVDNLKRKCTVKNRMIVTLLKGLQSNVPKEWWEELVEYIFDESKPIEEFDPEKVSEFIRQTSLFLLNGEKGSSEAPLPPRQEQLPSEEEPKTRGIMGADVRTQLKFLSYNDQLMAKIMDLTSDEFLDFRSPVAIMAYPAIENTEATIKKLENQISLLNTENDRLWHQVKELRQLLKSSIKEMNERVNVRSEPEQPATGKQSGKTINLTIQIADKSSGRLKEGSSVKILRVDGGSEGSLENDKFKSSPAAAGSESQRDEEVIPPQEQKFFESERKMGFLSAGKVKSSFNPKSSRRRSENDLNFLDEASPTVSDHKQRNEELRALLRERSGLRVAEQAMTATPHPSTHEMQKPLVWVPSQYAIRETSDGYRAGPSRRSDVDYLLQKPSVMELVENRNPGMFATMANERELQTIPENENADCCPSASSSKGVTQAIQRLRNRVRSMHKDVSVLKSKNDGIDKILGRLMDDVIENKQSFEEIEKSFNHFKDRLG